MLNTAYIFQASLVFIWWATISVSDSFYQIFSYSSIPKPTYFNLLIPDLFLLGILSLVRSYINKRDISLLILGAFAYATLFCINASISGRDGAIPTIGMIFGLFFNIFLVYPFIFMRSSQTKSYLTNVLKTIIQIASFWSIFLVVLPMLIIWSNLGNIPEWPSLSLLSICGTTFFLVFSILGLASAYYMVNNGEGTPLPFDATNKLVTIGPYARIRNPMALAGVGQIISISILFSSLPVAIYGIVGSIAWHFIVKPLEEDELILKFGTDYDNYRRNVRCWIPRINKN